MHLGDKRLEFHRLFYKIAANLVRCLSEASCERKVCEQVFCKKAVNGILVYHQGAFPFLSTGSTAYDLEIKNEAMNAVIGTVRTTPILPDIPCMISIPIT